MSEHIEEYNAHWDELNNIVRELKDLSGDPVETITRKDGKLIFVYPNAPALTMAAAADAIESLMAENYRLRQRVADLEKKENHHDESTGNP